MTNLQFVIHNRHRICWRTHFRNSCKDIVSDLNLKLIRSDEKILIYHKNIFKVLFGYIAIDSYDDKMDARMFVE